jgi:dihydropteroate synthase
MVDEGADLIDVGGESTRPHAEPVTDEEELRRIVPVIERLAARGVAVSVDTMKSRVAAVALAAGAQIVNDVTAFGDAHMARVCVEAGATVCLMHMQGDPKTMQDSPKYADVVGEVKAFLLQRAQAAEVAGVQRKNIWIDPGIGFGKSTDHNLALIREVGKLVVTGYPVLLGVSRKSFIGRLMSGGESPAPVEDRLEGSLAIQVFAQLQGVKILRVHDVKPARRCVDAIAAL